MIVFRVDINKEIASGHYMRCKTIANEFYNRGVEIFFIFSKLTSEIDIRKCPFKKIVINVYDNYNDEIKEIKKRIDGLNVDLIICDGYQYSKNYLETLNNYHRVLYIDDYRQQAYDIFGVLSYGHEKNKKEYQNLYAKAVYMTKMYFGRKYVPIRREFYSKEYKVRKELKNILITTGNTDNLNFIKNFLDYLISEKERNEGFVNRYKLNIKIGAMFNKIDYDYYIENISNIKFFDKDYNLCKLVYDSDYVVSAGGITLYEICSVGVPASSIAIAENQIENARLFDDFGTIHYHGNYFLTNESIIFQDIINYIDFLANDYEKRKLISKTMKEYIDIHGSQNLISQILIDLSRK